VEFKVWDPHYLGVMNERHRLLRLAHASTKVLNTSSEQEAKMDTLDITGWRILADPLNWKPCPIGVYYLQEPVRSLV
jgi:hypothetical protein